MNRKIIISLMCFGQLFTAAADEDKQVIKNEIKGSLMESVSMFRQRLKAIGLENALSSLKKLAWEEEPAIKMAKICILPTIGAVGGLMAGIQGANYKSIFIPGLVVSYGLYRSLEWFDKYNQKRFILTEGEQNKIKYQLFSSYEMGLFGVGFGYGLAKTLSIYGKISDPVSKKTLFGAAVVSGAICGLVTYSRSPGRFQNLSNNGNN